MIKLKIQVAQKNLSGRSRKKLSTVMVFGKRNSGWVRVVWRKVFWFNISVQPRLLPHMYYMEYMYYICYRSNVGASEGCTSFTEWPLSMLVPGSGVGRRGNWKHGRRTRKDWLGSSAGGTGVWPLHWVVLLLKK